jgi:hypothetical protein
MCEMPSVAHKISVKFLLGQLRTSMQLDEFCHKIYYVCCLTPYTLCLRFACLCGALDAKCCSHSHYIHYDCCCHVGYIVYCVLQMSVFMFLYDVLDAMCGAYNGDQILGSVT